MPASSTADTTIGTKVSFDVEQSTETLAVDITGVDRQLQLFLLNPDMAEAVGDLRQTTITIYDDTTASISECKLFTSVCDEQ